MNISIFCCTDLRKQRQATRRVQPTRCNVSQFIYFCKTLYMFHTGFPSIIRNSKLHIQRQVFVRPILLPADILLVVFCEYISAAWTSECYIHKLIQSSRSPNQKWNKQSIEYDTELLSVTPRRYTKMRKEIKNISIKKTKPVCLCVCVCAHARACVLACSLACLLA